MSQPSKKAGGLEEAFKRQKEAGDSASKILALEALVRQVRGEFYEFRRETNVELSRLDEFEDRMDGIEEEVSSEDLSLADLMRAENDKPYEEKGAFKASGAGQRAPSTKRADGELIELLHQQVASLTTALEEVTKRCEMLERGVAEGRPADPSPSDSLASPSVASPGSLAALLSRVAALESSTSASAATAATAAAITGVSAPAAPASAAAIAAPPSDAAAGLGASTPSRKTLRKMLRAQRAGVPVSAPSVPLPSSPGASAAPPAEPVPGTAAAAVSAPSWVEVVKKKKKTSLLNPALIESSSDPLQMLLSGGHRGRAVTTEIMVTQAVAPLSIKAQGRPYLAWRSILKIKTGMVPLHILLINPRRALLFWDVSDTAHKGTILRALDGSGFFKFPAEEGVIANHHLLRAYTSGYFKLLRQAALSLCPPDTVRWILDEAEAAWRKSKDKVRRLIWLRNIAADRLDLAEGFVVAAGVLPSLDPAWTEPPGSGPSNPTPRVSCQLWVREYIYLLREQEKARRLADDGKKASEQGA